MICFLQIPWTIRHVRPDWCPLPPPWMMCRVWVTWMGSLCCRTRSRPTSMSRVTKKCALGASGSATATPVDMRRARPSRTPFLRHLTCLKSPSLKAHALTKTDVDARAVAPLTPTCKRARRWPVKQSSPAPCWACLTAEAASVVARVCPMRPLHRRGGRLLRSLGDGAATAAAGKRLKSWRRRKILPSCQRRLARRSSLIKRIPVAKSLWICHACVS